MTLLFTIAAAVTASCTPNPSLSGAGPERVRAYFAAINARDEAAIGRFLAPGATYHNPQVSGMALSAVMDMLLAAPDAMQLEVVGVTDQGGEIQVRTRASDGTPGAARVTLEGGCIRTFFQTQ